MPQDNSNDEIFDKNSVPDGVIAKEFDDNKEMDDSAAFTETSDPAAQREAAEALAAVSNWRAAKCLKQLQAQVNAAFPGRSTASDGMIGDIAHCPGDSDHCPNIVDGGVGVVTAFDITHDPRSGCDMEAMTNAMIGSRDSRIKYIIYNRRICSSYAHGGVAAWTWRHYSGSNPHIKHAHFSVLGLKAKYDDTSPWSIDVADLSG